MNIIKMLWCRIKVRAVGLDTEEFFALCEAFERKGSQLAKKVLKRFFNLYTPDQSFLGRVYAGSDDLKELYLMNIRKNRRLMPYEQKELVERMPMNRFSRFPSMLDKQYLEKLFAPEQKTKLIAYVRGYILPPDLEHRLMELYAAEGEVKPLGSSYRLALQTYVGSPQKNKFQTPAVQLSLLALNDDELTIKLLENCSMDNNMLFIPTMKQIVEDGSKEVLNALLLNTFVVDGEFSRKIVERFPELRWAYEISKLRKPLRKLERETNDFMGALNPSKFEFDFIMKTIESEDALTEHFELPKMLAREEVTPYFCAWVASEYPEYAEAAYRTVRKIAEKYRNRYKSAKPKK